MAAEPARGYRALRRGRWSDCNADYFLTFCTESRNPGLHRPDLLFPLSDEIARMERECVWLVRCHVIMPDHVHLLVRLGDRLSLGKSVARLKAKTAAALRTRNLRWQGGYHDHRLRPSEDCLPYFLYVYLNPYRADLLSAGSMWPGFHCDETDAQWFNPLLADGLPEPAWLRDLP